MTTTCPELFAAHDAGLIRLPAPIVQLRDARDRAHDHLRGLTTPPHHLDARETVTAATVEAFITGEPLPTVDRVLDAERESRAFEHCLEVARNAATQLEGRIAQAVGDAAEEVITAALRPVFDATVAELRDAYTLLEPFETAGRGALALAATKVRTAAATADRNGHTYSVLRSAAAEVRSLLPAPEYDVDGEFAAFRDVHTVWPKERRTNFGAIPAPWESAPDPIAWQIRHLTPWLPTPAEQDAAWLEVYGEAYRARQIQAEKSRAMALTFGHGH